MNLENAFLGMVFFVVGYTLTLFTAGLNSVPEKILQLFVKKCVHFTEMWKSILASKFFAKKMSSWKYWVTGKMNLMNLEKKFKASNNAILFMKAILYKNWSI